MQLVICKDGVAPVGHAFWKRIALQTGRSKSVVLPVPNVLNAARLQ